MPPIALVYAVVRSTTLSTKEIRQRVAHVKSTELIIIPKLCLLCTALPVVSTPFARGASTRAVPTRKPCTVLVLY
jgi:hypothetical protein